MTTSERSTSSIEEMGHALRNLSAPVHVLQTSMGIRVTAEEPTRGDALVGSVGPLTPERLGAPGFRRRHGIRYAYMAGAMANGISSVELVAAMASQGYLASYGAGGVLPDDIDRAVRELERRLTGNSFAVNIIHSPSEPALERAVVDILLARRVRCAEASAFMDLTPSIVRYRAAGLSRGADGSVVADNRVIAKVSRVEVAERFLAPPPPRILASLVEDGSITKEQSELAKRIPVADDITVEADSGGHTDRRPLTVLLPVIDRVRNVVSRRFGRQIHLGAAGGIGSPRAMAAAFSLGADYVVTGSVNQSCVESGTSPAVRELLAGIGIADCTMAPAADMFELGVELQVARKGSLFPMRAAKLYSHYRSYSSLDELTPGELVELEQKILRRPVADVWRDVEEYFTRRDPDQLTRAHNDPHRRMALIFRWYLGMSTRWAQTGDPERRMDYQIWCGPAMGAFNDWVSGTYLATPKYRKVGDVARHLGIGAAVAMRYGALVAGGVRLPGECVDYVPTLPVTDS